jgi:hypothetical protein
MAGVTFLTPIPAAIAAALTIPVMVALYLLKLRRRPIRVSSTMLWTEAVRDLQVNIPLRLLRPSVLLLLHLTILGLFLLAMARPALDTPDEPPSRVVILIDRSASMGATYTGRTRLVDAIERASTFVDRTIGGSLATEACIVEFAAEPRARTGFTRDVGALKAALQAIDVADQPGDLRAALRLAGALAAGAGSPDESAPRVGTVVALFSDGSFTGAEPLTLTGASFLFQVVGPPPDEAARVTDNLGIVALAARRDYEDPALVRVFARILNAGSAPVTVVVTISLDGRIADRATVELPPLTAEGPGQGSVTFSTPATAGGVAVVSIERKDQLVCDDAAAVVLTPAARPRIVLVVPDPGSDGPEIGKGPEWILADVLQELGPRSFRVVPLSAYERFAAQDAGIGADLIVFDRAAPSRLPPQPSITFGAGLPIPGLRVSSPGPNARASYVLSWRRSHPVLRQVAMDAVRVAATCSVAATPDDPSISVTELVRGESGPLLLLLEQARTRRLLVTFDPADSTWPLNVGFPIFLAQAVDYLTLRGGDEAGGTTITSTQPAEVAVPRGTTRVRVRGPREFEVPVSNDSGLARLGVLDRAGIYEVTALPSGQEAGPIAVNLLDETESTLGVRPMLHVSGETASASHAGSGPREVWAWFVAAALALLAIEWFLYAWQMRV